ncbi:hypothetical protein SDC9_123707 [bioreactor metagenome]|uniref:DUF7660 domain-containing protein n=1 Tax=bioreactor metagenome TaxID=1076179 RepID=A0A645CIH4_9ZZZZ|nr:hypothetical protein [Oscillospiraceae bacterium]
MIYNEEYFLSINTKEKFIEHLNQMIMDFHKNKEQFQNIVVDDYLNSIEAWLKSYSFDCNSNIQFEKPDWSLIALLFYFGKIYE